MNEVYLIGLGNPGKKYIKSRHNIGYSILENFSKKYNSNFLLKDKLKCSYSEFKINYSTYRLFLPNTFMNNSGDAVRAIVDWYKIRFRKKGSSGGHNGLKSIIERLQTEQFNRIRIGIGSPPSINGTNNFNTISHVLGNISLEEKLILDKVYKRVIDSLEHLNTKKEEYIMNELNSFDKDQI